MERDFFDKWAAAQWQGGEPQGEPPAKPTLWQRLVSRFGGGPSAVPSSPPVPPISLPPGDCKVTLMGSGNRKLEVIKLLRELLGLGLQEAKQLVDSTPSKIVEGVDRNLADAVMARLIAVGASAKLEQVTVSISGSVPAEMQNELQPLLDLIRKRTGSPD